MEATVSLLPPGVVTQPRVLLAEDDPIQARVLATLVMRMGLCPIGPVATAPEALELCRHLLPTLAILDIELLGEADGIELGTQLQLLGQVPLVFLSATQDERVLRRMAQLHPLAFLPKPYRLGMLQQIISQVLMQQPTQELPTLPESAALPEPTPGSLFIRESNALVRLDVNDIISVQAVQQHAVLTLASGRRHSVRLTLADILAQLPAAHFIQCHRAWLINVHHIKHIALSENLVRLTDGTEATVGRAYRHNIQQHLHILG